MTDSNKLVKWYLYDWAYSAFATTVIAAILPVYYSKVAAGNLSGNEATIYWGYTTAIALLIVSLIAPIMGTIADFIGQKKRLLGIFTYIGVIATSLLYFISDGDWVFASILFVIGNIGFSISEVFYNSLLPYIAPKDKVDQISVRGYAYGYMGGGILLLLNVILISSLSDQKFGIRLSFIMAALWWAVFSFPLISSKSNNGPIINQQPNSNLIFLSFRRIKRTFLEIKKYRELSIFLIAFWIYNDGIGTIIKMATIYGAEIGISTTDLIGALIMTQFVGIPFALIFGRLANLIGTKNSIFIGLAVYTLISISAYFMKTNLHFWILAFMVATVQGGTQALSRSLFSSMVPKNKSGEFFGFYSMSSRFAGIAGPLIFSIVGQLTGSSRLSILSLVFFFLVGGFLLSTVDEKEGIKAASVS